MKITLLDHHNNHVECLSVDDSAKNFNILAINLSVSYIIILMGTKLSSDLYLVKFLDNKTILSGSCENPMYFDKGLILSNFYISNLSGVNTNNK